jgi:hypothetical protein
MRRSDKTPESIGGNAMNPDLTKEGAESSKAVPQ